MIVIMLIVSRNDSDEEDDCDNNDIAVTNFGDDKLTTILI